MLVVEADVQESAEAILLWLNWQDASDFVMIKGMTSRMKLKAVIMTTLQERDVKLLGNLLTP